MKPKNSSIGINRSEDRIPRDKSHLLRNGRENTVEFECILHNILVNLWYFSSLWSGFS